MQEDGTSHSWNLASKDKCSSVIFDRLLYYRVSIFVQISRNKLGQKWWAASSLHCCRGLWLYYSSSLYDCSCAFFPMWKKNGLSLQKQTHTKITISGMCSVRPARVRLRVGLDLKSLSQPYWFCSTICILPAWGSQDSSSKSLWFKVGILPGSVQTAEAAFISGTPWLGWHRKRMPFCSLQQIALGFLLLRTENVGLHPWSSGEEILPVSFST